MNRRARGFAVPAFLLMGVILTPVLAIEDDYLESAGGLMQPKEGDEKPSMSELGILANATELVQQKLYPEAEKYLLKSLEQFPDSKHMRYLLASVYSSSEKYPEAIKLLEQLLAQHPGDYRLMNNLSWVLSTASAVQYRNPAKALALAQDAVLIVPDDYHIWSTLAEAHFVNANFDQAVKTLQHGINLAIEQQADAGTLRTYKKQYRKLQEAASVMSLIEQ